MTTHGERGNLVIRPVRNMDGVTHIAWFFCPGCDDAHAFYLPRWQFSGSLDRPTMSPSLLNRAPHRVCHLFLRDGQLQFLSDCTHHLAGQTVPLPEPPEWL